MPNDCVNHITLYAGPSTINHIVEAGPALGTLVMEDFGDLRLYDYKILQVGKEAIVFSVTSAWVPANALWHAMILELDISFLKNEWYIEDGKAGVWIGESNGIDSLVPKISSLEWPEGSLEEKAHRFRTTK